MNCDILGGTGLDGLPLFLAALVALGLIVGGILVLVSRRRRRSGMLALLALLVVGGLGLGLVGASPASAACPPAAPTPAPNSLTITQTSVLAGLEPGDAPLPIYGTVTNDSDDDTYIDDVEVSIVAVTLRAGAGAGTCGVADFVLLDPVMAVEVALAGRETTTFAGASLGLIDAAWDQNACKGATVELRYVTG